MEFTELSLIQGGAEWRCTNAGSWFSIAAGALAVVGFFATGPVAIIAGTWGVLASGSGFIIDVGDRIAGC